MADLAFVVYYACCRRAHRWEGGNSKLSIIYMFVSSIVFSAVAMCGPNISVSYVEGSAYQLNGSKRKELSIGDSVSPDASIRLEAGATVQLRGVGADIYLNQEGTYAVRDLLAFRQKLDSPGVGRTLLASLASLFVGPEKNGVAGTRGANQGENTDANLMETSAEDDIEQARDYLQSGKYEEAIKGLTQALGEATEEEVPTIHYYLAYAYSLSGDTPHAATQMASAKTGHRRCLGWRLRPATGQTLP